MARTHHSHRRQKKSRSTARLSVAGGVTGVLGVATIAGAIVVLRTHQDPSERVPGTVAARTASTSVRSGQTLAQLKMGARLGVSTPDGFSYSLAAVKSGTADRPLASSRTPPPPGATLAYIDYVITNTGTAPALLDFPADLFVKRSRVPASAQGRCIQQPGVPGDMCTLLDHTDVVNTLGYAPPRSQDEDQYIPAGASYLVRVATDLPVSTDTQQSDLGLYVWNPRFAPNRHPVVVPFP